MKKIYLLIILLTPFIVFAEESKVEIKSIELISKSKDVVELKEASSKDLKLNFSLKFKRLNDYAKYKVVLKNNTDKDFEIDNQTTFNEGNFIKYEFIGSNEEKVLKANKEMTIHINISYIKDIDENKFSEGIYKEDNNISLELSNDEDVMKFIVNPNTSTGYIVLISIAIILSLLVIFFIKSKKVKTFLLVMILSIPIYAYALEKIKLDVETHVEIEEINTFILTNACHRSPEEFNFSLDDIEDEDEKDFYRDMFMEKEVYEFERGMTIEDFLNSEYYTNLDDNKKNWLNKTIKSKNPYTGAYEKLEYYSNELIECLSKIKTVEYYPDMTEEEVEETYRLELEAREETNNCFRNNVNAEKLYSNDIIINSKHGSYYSTLTCPT